MKTIITALIILISFGAQAQTDSTKLRSGKLTLRVNDWEYACTFIAYNETFENLYDSIKVKLRFNTYPTGTMMLSVDSVTNGELINLVLVMRGDYNAETNTAQDRIKTAIRNIGNSYVNSQLENIKAGEAAAFTARKREGKRRLRKE